MIDMMPEMTVNGRASVDLSTMDGRTIYDVQLGPLQFKFIDYSISIAAPSIFRELASGHNGVTKIQYEPGDIVLDIGANVGIVSIFLAKQLPDITVYAYEPLVFNYAHLKHNLMLNNIRNVVPVNRAVTDDGRDLVLQFDTGNMGGATAFLDDNDSNQHLTVQSVTLHEIFETHGIDRCKLLKLDAEGAEHEILRASADLFDRIDHISAEVHFNRYLRDLGYTKKTTEALLAPLAEQGKLNVNSIRVPD